MKRIHLSIIVFAIITAIYITYKAYIATTVTNQVEGMATLPRRCPNVLIQKGPRFYLYNSKVARVPGVNPVSFNNLEEYVEFLDWQRANDIHCPVLYVQEIYDINGEKVYKSRPSIDDLQAGLPDGSDVTIDMPDITEMIIETDTPT